MLLGHHTISDLKPAALTPLIGGPLHAVDNVQTVSESGNRGGQEAGAPAHPRLGYRPRGDLTADAPAGSVARPDPRGWPVHCCGFGYH